MATTSEYLTQLQNDKATLVDNLNTMGVSANDSEKFTSLVQKVLNIEKSSGKFMTGTYVVTSNDVNNGNINIPIELDSIDIAIVWLDAAEYSNNKIADMPSLFVQLFNTGVNNAYVGIRCYTTKSNTNYMFGNYTKGTGASFWNGKLSCSRSNTSVNFVEGTTYHYLVAKLS